MGTRLELTSVLGKFLCGRAIQVLIASNSGQQNWLLGGRRGGGCGAGRGSPQEENGTGKVKEVVLAGPPGHRLEGGDKEGREEVANMRQQLPVVHGVHAEIQLWADHEAAPDHGGFILSVLGSLRRDLDHQLAEERNKFDVQGNGQPDQGDKVSIQNPLKTSRIIQLEQEPLSETITQQPNSPRGGEKNKLYDMQVADKDDKRDFLQCTRPAAHPSGEPQT